MANRAAVAAPLAVPFIHRWQGRLGLALLSVLLLTLAFAPVKQFYLAWIGLVPWLWSMGQVKSNLRAFLLSWLAGTAFFLANLWWLLYVTAPGMIGLVIYLGLYWGAASAIFRSLNWLARPALLQPKKGKAEGPETTLERSVSPLIVVLGIGVVWTALERVRGTLFTGLPWLYLGHTQSPVLLVCQIADVLGVYGVSFCVAATNALVYLYFTRDRRALKGATALVAGLWIFSAGYGVLRLEQMKWACTPGPTVLLVQSNYPQDNSGNKGAGEAARVQMHLGVTVDALRAAEKALGRIGGVDLVCWSETEMPELNAEARASIRNLQPPDPADTGYRDYADFLDAVVGRVGDLAARHQTNLLTGGLYSANLEVNADPKRTRFTDRRNTAFLFRGDGKMAAEHADKIHLVPFGEFIPFKGSRWLGWLHDIFQSFSPYDFDYTLTPGPEDSPTVLSINSPNVKGPVRLVVPICFEDLDAPLVARMFRGERGKRADLIVNLTNDGWFRANQNAQHLQAAIFRSIENRAPTVRSVNTGISASIDSYGTELQRVAVRTEGTIVGQVRLDSRYTVYSRVGDLFAMICTGLTGLLVALRAAAWARHRRKG